MRDWIPRASNTNAKAITAKSSSPRSSALALAIRPVLFLSFTTSFADHPDNKQKKGRRSMPTTRVSAPGKVLMAGGYLVLERPNVGLVVAVNKRFHTTVTEDKSLEEGRIIVESPQFHCVWQYMFKEETLTPCLENTSMNDFVEKTLRVCLLYLEPKTPPQLRITIHLQSKGLERTTEAAQSLEKFLPCPKDENDKAIVNKTGLGSSAALVTSLAGALVHHYPANLEVEEDEDDDEDEKVDISEMIHNLAQISHCYAQGKVGSGFDVSAACHGTHVYRRFPICLLPDLLQQLEVLESHSDNAKRALHVLVEMTPWAESMVQTPRQLPKPLQIVLADVCGGSESPSMAKKVLSWKQEEHMKDPTAKIPHWGDLKLLNTQVVQLFQQLEQASEDDLYDALAAQVASEWPSNSILSQLSSVFQDIRKHLKQMGEAAGVPIEPEEQTALCNATMQVPGVLAALVPGAGGYDAIACLYIDRPQVLENIGKVWANYPDKVICPLGLQAAESGMRLEQKEE
jgi:phosphomevalonate kinase